MRLIEKWNTVIYKTILSFQSSDEKIDTTEIINIQNIIYGKMYLYKYIDIKKFLLKQQSFTDTR